MTNPLDGPPAHPAASLAGLMDRGLVLAGGCHDALSAVLLAEAGFRSVMISGAAVAASFGFPDLGLTTMPEVLEVARRVARRVTVPVIADIDTGFGGALNVTRAVDEFGAAGVAAVIIEDQEFPKRCGHLSGKQLIPADEYLAKIRAAVQVARGTGLHIIARTDALAVDGIDEAIERANRALDVGADVAFVESPTCIDEIEAIGARVDGRKLYNLVAGGHGPVIRPDDLHALGFDIVIVPVLSIYATVAATRAMATEVIANRDDMPLRRTNLTPTNLFEAVGLDDWLSAGGLVLTDRA